MATEPQTVVDETKDQAKPGTEGTDARKADDLDALLAEFEAGTKKPDAAASKPETTVKADDEKVTAAEIKEVRKELAEARFQREVRPVIASIRGDLPAEVLSDDEIVDLLDGRAKRDPRFAHAWQDRHQNPKAWEKVVGALGREIRGKFAKLPDAAATEDRAAVTAAVRGASTKAPEGKPPNFGGMSNSEFSKSVREQYGFDPGV